MRATAGGLGIIGTGRWADAHARAASRSDTVRFVNCYSRTAANREAFATRHGIDRTSARLDELLEDPLVEAVVVSSPNDIHARHTIQVLVAGKPALVDKPVAVDVAEALSVLRRARDAGPTVAVAHHARRLAGHRAATEWIVSGRAGRVRAAHADFSNPRGSRLTEDAWYRSARGSEAGVLIQVGIHQVDNLLHLLGPAREVGARLDRGTQGLAIPDLAMVTLRHTSGAISAISSSWTTPSHYRLDLIATGGNLEFRLDHRYWAGPEVDRHSRLTLDDGGTPRQIGLNPGDPLREQLEDLIGSAREGRAAGVSVLEGLRAVAVVEGAVRSARREGAAVSLEEVALAAGATPEEIRLMVGP